MYSKILRALSLLLALIMLSAVVISCDKASTNEDPETDTQVEPTDESRDICVFPPDPDIDFEGEEITILIRDNILYSREWCKEEAEYLLFLINQFNSETEPAPTVLPPSRIENLVPFSTAIG